MLDKSLGSEDVHTLPQWKAELDYEIQITYEQSCLHSRPRGSGSHHPRRGRGSGIRVGFCPLSKLDALPALSLGASWLFLLARYESGDLGIWKTLVATVATSAATNERGDPQGLRFQV